MKNPQCGEDKTVKNGSLTDRKPKYKCKVYGRQFCEKRIASNALIVHLTT
jgi:transposase-like protein